MQNLKEKTIRGGLARMLAQGVSFGVRIVSLMVLARLLSPADFGLVGMVTALTGVLNLFRDFGLSTASVQRAHVTDKQISALFWINVLVGIVLTVLTASFAPVVAAFYHDPRLVWITAVLALSFLFNAAGVQHSALLQRELRFTALSVISTIALVISTVVAVVMALSGFSYWSLVAMTILQPLINTVGVWLASRWTPGRPQRDPEVRSMMRFGGTCTLNGLVVYIAYNFEKVLLGRYWGAEVIGLYGRAYQLINIPTDNINASVGEVAFSALARVQDDRARLRQYFLKGYSLVVGVTLPITIACCLFAKDLVFVLLGPKWNAAVPIFRLLAPTILIFAIINPLGWLLVSLGLVGRSLKIALVLAPIVMIGYILGLRYGPTGVAFGYSAAMALWVVPHVLWCIQGTGIRFRDIVVAVGRPFVSGLIAAALGFAVQVACGQDLSTIVRLTLSGTVLLAAYVGFLWYVMGQRDLYITVLTGAKRGSERAVLSSA